MSDPIALEEIPVPPPYPRTPAISPPPIVLSRATLLKLNLPLLPGAPRASGVVFGWCVTTASFELEPKVIKAQFGDGYAQRRPAGINTQAHMWNLSMKNIDAKTAGDVLNFLSARNGVDVFNWTPPRTSTAQNVICPSWSLAYGDMLANGDLLYTLQFKFEQVFI